MMRTTLRLSALAFVMLASCAAPRDAHVRVEVSTSLAAGVDFVWVDTDFASYATGLPSELLEREQLRVRYQSSSASEWSQGVLAAEFDGVKTGTYIVRVALRTAGDDAVLVQDLIADIDGDTTLRLRLDRGCIATECPSASGSAALSACRQAACVDPRCDPTDLATRDELCPDVTFCDADADCEAPAADCAAAYCVDGTCIDAPSSGDVCPSGEYCDTRLGCRSLSDPLPECGTLCDLSEDDCAIGYWNCELSSPSCDPVSAVPTGSSCRRGDATGSCDQRGECVDCLEGATCVTGCLIGRQVCTDLGVVCDTSDFEIAMVGSDCIQSTGRPGFCDETGGCMGCPVGGCTEEVCNGLDDDSDGTIDEDAADAIVYFTDADGDSFGSMPLDPTCDQPPRTAAVGGDCDDDNREQFPGAPTFCNELDDDCDGDFDEDMPTWYFDVDMDGYGGEVAVVACAGPPGTVGTPGDCDDGSETTFPGATEICDGVDNDCTAGVDDGDPGGGESCGSDVGACSQGALRCAGGALVCVGGTPSSDEVCDGVDNNCDGSVDDGNPGGGGTCDPDGVCTFGAQACLGGALSCQPGPECDCVPDLPCVPSNVCEDMGVTVCRGGVSSCRGTPRTGACGAEDIGEWSACAGFDDVCDETGTQSRTVVRPMCVDGGCDSAPDTETRACLRDQENVVCGESTTVPGADCAFMTSCVEDGVSTRIRTDFSCRDAACEGADTTLFDPCTRDTDGSTCGSVSFGAWRDCEFPTLCANDGTQTRDIIRPLCVTGMCDMQVSEDSRACTRNTTGVVCAGPDFGPWTTCGPNLALPVCSMAGIRARDFNRTLCERGVCSDDDSGKESEPCALDTDGDSCGEEEPGPWGPCEFEDQCVLEGRRSRSVRVPECSGGGCDFTTRTETGSCGRETSGDRCAVSQDLGWSSCILEDCSSTTGNQYHTDDGACRMGRCTADGAEGSKYAIPRECTVPRTEGEECTGPRTCGIGVCRDFVCTAEPLRCGALTCCFDECVAGACGGGGGGV